MAMTVTGVARGQMHIFGCIGVETRNEAHFLSEKCGFIGELKDFIGAGRKRTRHRGNRYGGGLPSCQAAHPLSAIRSGRVIRTVITALVRHNVLAGIGKGAVAGIVVFTAVLLLFLRQHLYLRFQFIQPAFQMLVLRALRLQLFI